jgi:predicted transport protein
MALYRSVGGRLKVIKSIAISNEKSVQTLIENNLLELLGIHFLATEYRTIDGTGRLDTLGVDGSGAPVIIEYKKRKDDNVITQALSYLYWLKSQDYAFFEKMVAKKLGVDFAKKIKDNWIYPRVICIAGQYNKNDINAVKVIPNIRLELYLHRMYENDIFCLDEEVISIQRQQTVSEPKIKSSVDTEFTIESHASYATEVTRQLFFDLHDRIKAIDENITERPTSEYIAYRLTKVFAEVHIQKKKIQIYLRPREYEDPKNMVSKISESYGWVLDRRMYLSSTDDLDYAMTLIEQSYQDVL